MYIYRICLLLRMRPLMTLQPCWRRGLAWITLPTTLRTWEATVAFGYRRVELMDLAQLTADLLSEQRAWKALIILKATVTRADKQKAAGIITRQDDENKSEKHVFEEFKRFLIFDHFKNVLG